MINENIILEKFSLKRQQEINREPQTDNWLGIDDYVNVSEPKYSPHDKFSFHELVDDYLEKTSGYLATNRAGEIFAYNPTTGLYSECEPELEARLERLLKNNANRRVLSEIMSAIKHRTLKTDEELTPPPHLLLCKNGILNLETRTLEPFNSKYFFVSRINAAYNPEAKCPQIKKFFDDITNNPEDSRALLEFVAFCLAPDYPIHRAFFFWGSGSNGKSTYLTMLSEFLNKENCSMVSIQKLGERFKLATLYGKLANLSNELPNAMLLESDIFKSLTGGDLLEAEKKHLQRPLQFRNRAKMVFAANRLPKIKDESDGLARRLRVIIFSKTFREDKTFIEKLTTPEEFSGLLNAALEVLPELLARAKFTGDMDVAEARAKYERLSDSVSAFCTDALVEDSEGKLVVEQALSVYLEFCKNFKYPVGVLSKESLGKELRKRYPHLIEKRETFDDGKKSVLYGMRFVEKWPNETSWTGYSSIIAHTEVKNKGNIEKETSPTRPEDDNGQQKLPDGENSGGSYNV